MEGILPGPSVKALQGASLTLHSTIVTLRPPNASVRVASSMVASLHPRMLALVSSSSSVWSHGSVVVTVCISLRWFVCVCIRMGATVCTYHVMVRFAPTSTVPRSSHSCLDPTLETAAFPLRQPSPSHPSSVPASLPVGPSSPSPQRPLHPPTPTRRPVDSD